MKQSKLTILLIIKSAKRNKKGDCPLNCRLTFNKKRKEFASGLKTNPNTWNAKLQILESDSLLNSNLEVLRLKSVKKMLNFNYIKINKIPR